MSESFSPLADSPPFNVPNHPILPKNVIVNRPDLFTRTSSTVLVAHLPPTPAASIHEPNVATSTPGPNANIVPLKSRWGSGRNKTVTTGKPAAAVAAKSSDEDLIIQVLRHPSFKTGPSPPPSSPISENPNPMVDIQPSITVDDDPTLPQDITFKRPHLFTRISSTVPPFPPGPIVAIAEPVITIPARSPPDADELPPKSHWWRFGRKKTANIEKPVVAVAADIPVVILPSQPTDHEKFLYAKTNRVPLYIFGTFSFLSVSAGMWFFTIAANKFYWFGIFGGLIQIYLIISYTVGYMGKDFDVKMHEQIIQDYPVTVEPSVDVYLPCCGEPLEVLENTYNHVAKLDYTNIQVHVLDDGGSDTVKRSAESYGFNYITRDNKPYLKKAGNLRYAFARTSGDFFCIFDADFCPRPDFLKTLLPYMLKHEDIAIVQSPQFFRPREEHTWVEQGASSTQELFYRIVQVNRDRWGASICVGSNAVYRREALVEVGGTAEIGHSEDVHTGFYALTRGWRLKYIPLALACGLSPDTAKAFFSQQMRWCSGSTTLLTNADFWRSKLNVIQKICFLSGMMYYSGAGLMIFLNPLPGLLMIWLLPNHVLWYNCSFAGPSLIYSIFIFRLWSRQRYNFNVNFVFVVQQYAYLMAVKDRIFGTTASWVPSGDNKSHGAGEKALKKKAPNNKYRNMRILCAMWVFSCLGGVIAGTTVRILEGYPFYNFIPVLVLDVFNVFIAHKFIFYS